MFLLFLLIIFCLFLLLYYLYTPNKNYYLKGIDVVYWINLDRARERKYKMEKMFKDIIFNNINIHRIQAIDGKDKDIQNFIKKNIYITNKSSNYLEYACLLSHLNTIREFSESDYDIALILEDDMTLEYKPYWETTIEYIIKNAPQNWEIIQLCYIVRNVIPNKMYTLNEELFHSTGAYIINKNAAKKFIKNIFIENKYNLDVEMSHNTDIYLYKELITYTYKYPFFIYETNNDSYIHSEHIEYIHNRSKNLISQYIYN